MEMHVVQAKRSVCYLKSIKRYAVAGNENVTTRKFVDNLHF